MKTNTCFALVVIAMSFAACGKKSDDKPAESASVLPQTQKRVSNGQVEWTFANQRNDAYMCRVVTAESAQEWTPCPTGKFVTSVSGSGQNLSLEVMDRNTQQVLAQEIVTAEELVLPAPAVGEPTAVSATPLYDLNSGMISFGGNSLVSVSDNMRLIRYANSNGLRKLNSYSIITNDPMIMEFTHITPCETYGGSMGLQPNLRAFEVFGQSSPNATPERYCYFESNIQSLRQWEEHDVAADQIEIASDANAPFKYLRFSMFQNRDSAAATRRMFTEQCGVPDQYLASIVDNTDPRGNFPALNGASRPSGFIAGGTAPNLEVRTNYMGSRLQVADVHWCLADKTIGMQRKRLFFATFELNRVGHQTSDKVEVHLVEEAVGQVGFEAVRSLVSSSLGNLHFSLPNAN